MAQKKKLADSGNLNQIIASAAQVEQPTPLPDLTPLDLGIDLEDHKLEFELACLREQLDQLQDTHELRLNYTGHIFKLVCAWLGCVVVCILLSGFKFLGFKLSDSVLIAFITSTTVNVVGLFVLVAKWMFPAGQGKATSEELNARAQLLRQKPPGSQTKA